VILDSPSEIFASEISTGGGDITLNAIADIQLNGSVNSSGGNIEITTGNFFRVLSSFTNDNGVNASISSAGNGDGRITIRHQGGVETPFIIGDGTTNGTEGAIASNSEVISPTFEVPVPPSVYTQGNITIITSAPGDNTDAILPPPEPLPDTDNPTDDNPGVIPVAPAPTNNNDPVVPLEPSADEVGSQRFSVSDPAADEVGSERFSVSDPAADEVGSERFSVSDPAADEVGSQRFSVSDPATDEVGSERFSVSDPAADEVGSERFSVSDPAADEVGSERFSVSDPAADEVGSQRFSVSDPATDEVGSQRFSVSDPEISLETQTVLDQNLNRKTLEPLEYPGFLSTERILYLDVTVLPLAFASEELGAIGNQEAIAISSEVAAITEFSQVNDAAFTNTTNTGVEVELTASFSQGSEALADINSVNSVSFSNRTTNGTTNAIINTNPTTNGITNAATGIFAAAMGDRTSVSSATSTTATATANNSTSNSSQSANNSTSTFSQSANNSTSNSSQSANNSTSNSSQSANNSTSNSSQSANNSTSTSNSSQEQSSSASNEASMEKLQETMADGDMVGTVWQIEQMRNQEIEQLFGITAELDEQEVAITAFQNTLRELAAETGKEAAILYVLAQTEQLELILVTSEGTPIRTSVPEATRDVLFPVVQEFRKEVTDPRRRGKTTYLASAQQLYEWLISPIEDTLTDLGIETLMFSMGQGMRSLPIAALHDGEQFLIQKYSISLIPSFSLTNTEYKSIKNAQVLAMGISEFTEFPNLPAVPTELATVIDQLGTGKSLLNDNFTFDNLTRQREENPYPILHLATHSDFKSGEPSNSFVQLWDRKLTIDTMPQMGWSNPPVELLVLSACRTAIGDRNAELGFAGLAVLSGAKSALASLWYISDRGTLALMSEFYQQLAIAPVKVEALQEAQIAMLSGQVRIEGDRLKLLNFNEEITLPAELTNLKAPNLQHPYFWSAFIIIGSPW
jgi:CHAT domain-containing protein